MANWQVPVSLQSAVHPPSDAVTGQNTSIQIAYALRVPAGITKVTVQLLGIARSSGISVTEWSNIVAYLPGDGANRGGGTVAATAGASPAITTTQNNDLVVGAMNGGTTATGAITLNNAGSTPNTGWTALTGLLASAQVGAIAYQIVATAAAGIQVAWTWVTSTTWGGVTAAFKSSGTPALINQTETNFGSSTVNTVTIPATTDGNMLLVVVSQNAATTADLLNISDNGPIAFPSPSRLFAPRKIFKNKQFRPYLSDQKQVFPVITSSNTNFAATASDVLGVISDIADRATQSFNRTADDTLPSISETATQMVALLRSAVDSLAAITESTAVFRGISRTASDTLNAISDSATRIISLPRTAADSLAAITETAIRNIQLARTSSDTLATPSDSATRLIKLSRTASDALAGITEATAVFRGIIRTASDTLGAITDSAIRVIQSFNRSASDTIATPSDSVLRQPQSPTRTASDVINGISETTATFKGIIRTATDTLGAITDSAIRAVQNFNRIASDTIAVPSDNTTRQPQSFLRTVSDSLASISESTSTFRSILRTAADTLNAISDTTSRLTTHPRTSSDSLGAITDLATRQPQSRLRTAIDFLGNIIDSVVAQFGGAFMTFKDVPAITWSRDGKGEVHSRE